MFSFMNRGDTMAFPLDGRQSFSRAVFRARETHAGGPGREEPPDERPASGEGSRLPRTPHVKGYSLWRIFTAVGGLIMIISFFTPWWGMRIDVRGTQVGDETACDARRPNMASFDRTMLNSITGVSAARSSTGSTVLLTSLSEEHRRCARGDGILAGALSHWCSEFSYWRWHWWWCSCPS